MWQWNPFDLSVGQFVVLLCALAIVYLLATAVNKTAHELKSVGVLAVQIGERLDDLNGEMRSAMLEVAYELKMIRKILEERTGITAAAIQDLEDRARDADLRRLAEVIEERDSKGGSA